MTLVLPLFVENVIRENQWGGVDIRRGGIPVLRSNLICFGYSDGVVVGDEGKGLIEGNTIYGEEHGPRARGWGPGLPGRQEAQVPSSLGVLRKSLASLASKTSSELRELCRPSQNEEPLSVIHIDSMQLEKQSFSLKIPWIICKGSSFALQRMGT